MESNDRHSVKCLDMSYDSSSDMITWELYFMDKDKIQKFAYPSEDLKKALNINVEITQDDWSGFCKKMQGKEFSLVMPIEEAEDVE